MGRDGFRVVAKRAGLVAAVIACATLGGSIATGQLSPPEDTAPPVVQNVDGSGVDLASGRFNFDQQLLSIGPDGPQGLTYARYWNGDNWRDNLTGTLAFNQQSGLYTVSFGDHSETFREVGQLAYESIQKNGSTLTWSSGQYRYTASDGTTALLAPVENFGATGAFAVVEEVRHTNGLIVDFHYKTASACYGFGSSAGQTLAARPARDMEVLASGSKMNGLLAGTQPTAAGQPTVAQPIAAGQPGAAQASGSACYTQTRLQSVTNTPGYQIKLSYAAGMPGGAGATSYYDDPYHDLRSVVAINNAFEACNSFADECALAQSWARVQFVRTGGTEEVIDPTGRRWTLTYDTATPQRLVTVRRPGSTVNDIAVTYQSTWGPTVDTVTNASGAWQYHYGTDSGFKTVTVMGALGAQQTVYSDSATGLVRQVRGALSQTTRYDYDAAGRLTQVTHPEGNAVVLAYDGRGNVTSQTQRSKDQQASIVTRAEFPATCASTILCNKPIWTRDAAGRQTDYGYDPGHGGLRSITAPAGANGVRPQQRIEYQTIAGVALPARTASCRNQQSCDRGADETATTLSYGRNLQPVSSSTGPGNGGALTAVTAMDYDPHGNLVYVDGPLASNDFTRTWYDLARRPTSTIGPDPDGSGSLRHRATLLTYAADGAPLEQVTGAASGYDPNGIQWLLWTRARYDAWGRAVGAERRTGAGIQQLTEQSYDALGRVDCVAQRMNRSAFGGSAHACQLTAQGLDGPDRITRTHYDAAGRVRGQQSGVGTADEGWDWRAEFTSNGLRESLFDGENNRTTFLYDGFDRLATTMFPTAQPGSGFSNGADYEYLTYDPWGLGQVRQHRLRDGRVIGYEYDALGNVTRKDVPNTTLHEQDASYTYDNFGRLTSAVSNYTAGRFTWDALGRLSSEGRDSHGYKTFGYDLAGRRTRMTWRDNVSVVYDRLVTGELSEVREGSGFRLANYGWDDLGRREWLQRGNGARTSWGYDSSGNMSVFSHDLAGTAHDQTYTYTYNPAGQLASRTASNDAYSWTGQALGDAHEAVNGLNQVTQSGSEALAYSARGDVASAGGRSFEYGGRLARAGWVGPVRV